VAENAAVNFDTYQNLQRHRAVLLAIARLLFYFCKITTDVALVVLIISLMHALAACDFHKSDSLCVVQQIDSSSNLYGPLTLRMDLRICVPHARLFNLDNRPMSIMRPLSILRLRLSSVGRPYVVDLLTTFSTSLQQIELMEIEI